MIYILSYYNQNSKNGGAYRLDSLAKYMSNINKVDFFSLSTDSNSLGAIKYWKNAGILIQIWVFFNKIIFSAGLILTKDPYYKKQALSYYNSKIKSSDTFVVSYPTLDDILIGIKIMQKHKCKLNIDFRDYIFEFPLEKLSWVQRRRLKNLFKKIGDNDLVLATAVSPPICNSLKTYFKNVHCITNFRPIVDSSPVFTDLGENIHILYFGSISDSFDRSPKILFDAILLLAKKNKNKNFFFSFYGKYTKTDISFFASLKDIRNLTLKHFEPISENELGKYDFAILWGVPGNPGYVSSKFFSYLQLKIPIIAAAEGNQVGKYIENFSVGYSYPFDKRVLVKGFSKLENSKELYNADLTFFSDEYVLKKWSSLIF